MSSVVFGCIVPHPPIVVPEVGRSELRKADSTVNSMKSLAEMLGRTSPETLVVISPHGPIRPDAMGVPRAETTHGSLAMFGAASVRLTFDNDRDFVASLEQEAKTREVPVALIGSTRGPYELDHGIVVPMYYLRQSAPGASLVPLTFSFLPYSRHFAFGQAIRAAANKVGKRVAVIASGDLSHRLTRGAPAGYDPLGKELDKTIVDAVASADVSALMNIDPMLVERGGECGLRSIIVLMGALDGIRFTPRVLSYEGPFGVGYLVAAFQIEEAQPDQEPPRGQAKPASTKGGIEIKESCLGSDHPLVGLAKNAVEAYIREGRHVEVPDSLTEEMAARAGVFVCIKKRGHLRGCIGTFEPTRTNVAEETIHNAVSSATQDPRFPRVSPDELPDLTYTVDVLSTPEPINGLEELDPKRYGVIVESGYRRGLLLPDLEGVDSVDEQVMIARQKAGIKPNESVRLYRFEVKRYGEPVD
ncbi:MAG: AmmeMemoRadiSam system protein A [Chloroflexota bacterium]